MKRNFGGTLRPSLWLMSIFVLFVVLLGDGHCAQAVGGPGRYVLEKVETDFENKNRGTVNVGGAVRVTETTHQRDIHEVGIDGRVLDFHAKWTFEAPPKELLPGQELSLKVSGSCTSSDPANSMLSTALYYASSTEMWLSGKNALIGKNWNREPAWVPESSETTRYIVPLGPLPGVDVGQAKPIYAQILSIELNVDTKVFATYHYRWEEKSESLETAVRRVLGAFARKKRGQSVIAAQPRGPRFTTVAWASGTPRVFPLDYVPSNEKAQLQLVSQACPSWSDLLRTNLFGDMTTKEAESLTPDVNRIITASIQKPTELRDILLQFLYSTGPENSEVYRLLMAGEGNSVIFNNLAKTLSPNDKLLRYARGRDRFCRNQQQRDWESFVADGKFAAAFFFATVDLTLNLCDMPVVQGSSLVLSYVQIFQRVADKDPTLNETINIDTLKLARDAGLSRPEMPAEITGPFSYTLVLTDYWRAREEWKAKWLDDPNRNLSEATQTRLDATKCEGAWLDELDNTRLELGRKYVFNRAIRGAFDAIFAKNRWELEPLTFFNSPQHREHVMARREVIRRMDEARAQIPATAYYGGWVDPASLTL